MEPGRCSLEAQEAEARVYVPLRVYPRRSKTILALYTRIRDHYLFAMAYVKPSETTYRWEPHLVIDRAGLLQGTQGLAVISGPVVLLKYYGLRDILMQAARQGCLSNVHLAAWGVPGILAIDSRAPEGDEEGLLPRHELDGVRQLNAVVARVMRVVEV